MNKTAVFSGQMNQIVFSPWNVPSSFKKRNLISYCQKQDYLAKHDMEWLTSKKVRQRPGPQNAL
jgi:murein L,D-transpeptidase YcbB/YkuD